jgi:hypothetical protein
MRNFQAGSRRGICRFENWQLEALRKRFTKIVYLMPDERKRLADELNLSEEQVCLSSCSFLCTSHCFRCASGFKIDATRYVDAIDKSAKNSVGHFQSTPVPK